MCNCHENSDPDPYKIIWIRTIPASKMLQTFPFTDQTPFLIYCTVTYLQKHDNVHTSVLLLYTLNPALLYSMYFGGYFLLPLFSYFALKFFCNCFHCLSVLCQVIFFFNVSFFHFPSQKKNTVISIFLQNGRADLS